MICLTVEHATGSPLYFDIHHVARQCRGEDESYLVSGTLGDGLYEGEVLVEKGDIECVTFADDFLAPGMVAELFARIDRQEVVDRLSEAVREMTFCIDRFPALEGRLRERVVACHVGELTFAMKSLGESPQLELPLGVAEGSPVWRAA